MGDTIGTQGMHTYAVDKGYDRRAFRAKNSADWNTLTIRTEPAIIHARSWMGVKSCMVNPKLSPITFYVEPVAENYFLDLLKQGRTEDEAYLEVTAMRPCPVYLRGGYNQILLHNRRK
jgi:hypothetical protein